MRRKEKRLVAARANPGAVRFDALASLLESHGFEQRRSSGGSHVVFVHAASGLHVSIPRPPRGPVKRYYVEHVLSIIEDLERDSEHRDG